MGATDQVLGLAGEGKRKLHNHPTIHGISTSNGKLYLFMVFIWLLNHIIDLDKF
jgi:hypothetical protein